MQHLSSVFVTAALATTVVGQVNPFVFYPQDPERQTITCTSFVGRPDWNRGGEALMAIDPQHFRGVADANGVGRLFGVYHWVADEKLSTVETYDLVVRKPDATGTPDMSATGELLRIAGLTTPPSSNTQRGTWIMYDGFNLGGGLLVQYGFPSTLHAFVGVDLPANPLWPASDGHSLFRADLLAANSSALVGDNERAGAPNPTWAGPDNAPPFSTPWTYILGPFVTSPNLHLGGTDPTSSRLGAPGANLGMNGLYPDVSGNPRRDGLMVRVTDNLAPFGWCFLGAALDFQYPSYFGPTIGHSHIGGIASPPPFSIEISMLQNSVHELTVALPGAIPTAMVGQHLMFQAVVYDGNTNLSEWTNAQAVYF